MTNEQAQTIYRSCTYNANEVTIYDHPQVRNACIAAILETAEMVEKNGGSLNSRQVVSSIIVLTAARMKDTLV